MPAGGEGGHRAVMSAASPRPSVLVVDDDDGARDAMVRALERAGYRVHGASEPREALRIARGGDVDLAVVDVFLPLMSGLALAHSLSRENPTLRVLYVSGHTRSESVTDPAVVDPRVDFLEKPFELPELEAAVARLLATE